MLLLVILLLELLGDLWHGRSASLKALLLLLWHLPREAGILGLKTLSRLLLLRRSLNTRETSILLVQWGLTVPSRLGSKAARLLSRLWWRLLAERGAILLLLGAQVIAASEKGIGIRIHGISV